MYAYFHTGRAQRSQWSLFRKALLIVLYLVIGIQLQGTCFSADFKVQLLLKLKKVIGRLASEIQCIYSAF